MKSVRKLSKLTIAIIVIAILALGAGSTFAILISTPGSFLQNTFKLADVNTHIDENFKKVSDTEYTKEVSVVNDGPTVAYIRARITVSPNYWNKGVTLDVKTGADEGWWDGQDGFYYYKKVTDSKADPDHKHCKTSLLMSKVIVDLEKVQENFDITIYQEAVEAIGKEGGSDVDSLDTIKAAFANITKQD